MISTISVGVDHINIQYCRDNNIKVGHIPDILSDSDVAIALILMTTRKLLSSVQHVTCKERNFNMFSLFNELVGTGLKNKVIGIIGLARIGYEIAKRLSAFGVNKVLYFDHSGPKPIADFNINNSIISVIYVPMEELLKQSDFVIVACALNDKNTHIANKSFFNQMKKTAFFYNVASGKLVDTTAHVEALEHGEIAGCGLDVTEPEPIPFDHKLLTFKMLLFCHILELQIQKLERI
eukprot:NODE_671_length_5354_cov_0.091722.p4 type:complete len:236 gc:universal NODE_671_length_5354_cov_0.091722:1337-2044(+)